MNFNKTIILGGVEVRNESHIPLCQGLDFPFELVVESGEVGVAVLVLSIIISFVTH